MWFGRVVGADGYMKWPPARAPEGLPGGIIKLSCGDRSVFQTTGTTLNSEDSRLGGHA